MNFYQLNDPKSLRAKNDGRFNKIDIIVIAYNTIDIDKWIYPKSPTNPLCTRDGWKHLENLCRNGVVGVKLPQQTCLGVGDTTTTPHLVGVGEVLKRSVLMVSISIY